MISLFITKLDAKKINEQKRLTALKNKNLLIIIIKTLKSVKNSILLNPFVNLCIKHEKMGIEIA